MLASALKEFTDWGWAIVVGGLAGTALTKLATPPIKFVITRRKIWHKLEEIALQFEPNGGNSMFDRLSRMEQVASTAAKTALEASEKADEISNHMENLDEKVGKLIERLDG